MGGREGMSKRMGFDVEREMKHLKKIVERDDSVKITSRFTKYLIEQAERVEELERELERIKVKYRLIKEVHYSCSKSTSELEQQNERYREALEKLTDESLDLWDAVFIAREALEGEGE